MALMMNDTAPNGLKAPSAYHRVEQVHLEGKANLYFKVRSYASDSGNAYYAERSFVAPYNMDGRNVFVQAYEHLKTLEDFKHALDC